MAKDISPELYKELKEKLNSKIQNSKALNTILEGINSGKLVNSKYGYQYSEGLGKMLAETFQEVLSSDVLPDGRMYYNIAKSVVEPLLKDNYNAAADVAAIIQQQLNEKSNIGLNAIKPEIKQDRIDGIINRLDSEDDFDKVKWILNEPVVVLTQSANDDCIRENVEFQSKSGLTPKIRRVSQGKCCPWCDAIVGVYDYSDLPDDIYRRHDNCRCIVEYDGGDGKRQNVWSKIIYSEKENAERKQRIKSAIEEAEKAEQARREAEKRKAFENEQIGLIKKYGNEENMLLFGDIQDLLRYEELKKVTNLSYGDIRQRLIDDTENWVDVLKGQDESLRKKLYNHAIDFYNDAETSAFRSWTSEMYADINRFERYGINVAKPAQNVARELEKALDRSSLQDDLIVKRGIDKSGLSYMLAETKGIDGWRDNIEKLIGHSYVDNGFVATSPFEGGAFGGEVRMYIDVPKGTKAAYIEAFSHAENEKELLIQKGYEYTIINVKKVPNAIFKDEYNIEMWVKVNVR